MLSFVEISVVMRWKFFLSCCAVKKCKSRCKNRLTCAKDIIFVAARFPGGLMLYHVVETSV